MLVWKYEKNKVKSLNLDDTIQNNRDPVSYHHS